MIKKLRYRFIGIAMLSMTLVLASIIATINVVNYVRTTESIDLRMEMINERGDHIPQKEDFTPRPGTGGSGGLMEGEEYKDQFRLDKKLNAEAAFDTRYFTVTVDADGEIVETNTTSIAAVDDEAAVEYVKAVMEKGSKEGYTSLYKYEMFPKNNGTVQYVFLDCERELSAVQQDLIASILISLLGLLLVLLLVVILSRRIMQPVAESYEKQKRFITDASHEIKTPLTIIDANTEVLEMVHGEDEWTKSTRKQIKRLTALTEKLVFLSRMDEENSSYMEMLDFNLSEAVLDTAEPFYSIAQAKGKELTLQVKDNITYHGDEGTIRQMVSILLDNAMKYSDENGKISLTLSTAGKSIYLSVWNTTEPMKPGRYDILFERFYRAEASHNSKTGGFGIGLSVVQAIVQAHKGKITAKSVDGKSIVFSVVL